MIPALEELKGVDQWVAYRFEVVDGRRTKVPYVGNNGHKADATEPSTWRPFSVAASAYQKAGHEGVGFVVSPNDPYTGIDLDHCRDAETGAIEGWAQAIVDRFSSYTEITPSREGLRIWIRGRVPADHHRKGHIEIYDRSRYFTVTGKHLEGTPTEIHGCQDQLDAIYAELWPEPVAPRPSAVAPSTLNDAEVLDRARRAKNGATVAALLAGDTAGYDSGSEADLALISLLAHYTQDRGQLARLYRGSGLYRAKWERSDYRERTIDKALSNPTGGYGGKGGRIGRGLSPIPAPAQEADPQPAPLGAGVEFPLLALPEGIRAYITATAAAMNVAPTTVAVACLGALSGAVGATVEIEVKPDWHESGVLWLALVLRPGASKTPVLAEVTRPLHEKQARYFEDHRAAMTTFDASGAEAKPTAKRIVASDTTVEKLAALLGENPRGLLLHRDEMTGFVRSMNQYKGAAGADRSHYLSMWSSSPLLVDRKSSATVHVFRPFVSILAGLQPEMLSELQDRFSRDDGFLDRVLFACPDVPPAKWTDATIPHPVRERWRRTIMSLLSRDLTMTDGRPQPMLRRFGAAGRTAWVEMYNEHCGEMNSSDLSPLLLGPYSKLSAYAARIALLLHEARHVEDGDDADAEADERTVYAAWSIVDYFKTQQRHVFGLLAQSPEDRRLVAIHRWLVRQGGEATLRALVRANVAGIGNAEQARDTANRLVARGWVELVEKKNEHTGASVVLRVVQEGVESVG